MKLLAVIILAGTSYLIITFLGLLLAIPLFSISWQQLQNIISTGMLEADSKLLYYLQGLQTIGLFLVPAIMAHLLIFKKEEVLYRVKYSRLLYTGFLVVLTLILSGPVLRSIIQWNTDIQLPDTFKELESTLQTMEEERVKLLERLMAEKNGLVLLVNILIISILPALGEEFFFRGVVQRIFMAWFKSAHLGILIAAICFSISHFQFYGFFPRLLLGLYFGYLYFWSRNIWFPVLAHFFNNTIAIIFSFISDNSGVQLPGFFTDVSNNSAIVLIISLIITTYMVILTRRSLIIRIKRINSNQTGNCSAGGSSFF